MNFSDANESKTTKAVKQKPKPIVAYYCTKGQYVFDIPKYETDGFGNIIKDDTGKPKRLYVTDVDGNNRHAANESFKFDRFPVKDPKTGKTDATTNIGRFLVHPDNQRYQDLIDRLEICRRNKYNGILTEDEYKEFVNPIAFQHESEKNVLKSKNEDLQDENTMLRAKLAEKGIKI